MRMRKRHNLSPRMEKCAELLIADGQSLRGKWRESFPEYKNIFVELGCGKGRFTADTAETMPDTLLIAVELVADAMIVAMERIKERGLKNVRFINGDAKKLAEIFSDAEIDRLYINFCDPWPKSRDAKFRLTAPAFLRIYSDVLPVGGQIHFKTDNTPLFDWSVERFTEEGWDLSEVTHDLHKDGQCGIMTDYEAKFTAEGMKINRLVAAKTEKTLSTDAGEPPRLRNSSLVDARGYAESISDNAEKKEAEE